MQLTVATVPAAVTGGGELPAEIPELVTTRLTATAWWREPDWPLLISY